MTSPRRGWPRTWSVTGSAVARDAGKKRNAGQKSWRSPAFLNESTATGSKGQAWVSMPEAAGGSKWRPAQRGHRRPGESDRATVLVRQLRGAAVGLRQVRPLSAVLRRSVREGGAATYAAGEQPTISTNATGSADAGAAAGGISGEAKESGRAVSSGDGPEGPDLRACGRVWRGASGRAGSRRRT